MTDPTSSAAPPTLASPVPHITEKSRKDEILAAYQDLLKRYESKALQSRGKEQEVKRGEEGAAVQRASSYTLEKIVQGCQNLEAAIRSHLLDTSERLINESKKLQDMQTAIQVAERRLKEIHDIEIAAATLTELLESCQAKERQMEEERERRLAEVEQEVQRKRAEWQREEEEHAYNLVQKRKHEEQEHREQKAAFDRELAEQRTALEREAQELKAVRERAKTFDRELESAVRQAREEAEQHVRNEEKVRSDLREQVVLREKEVASFTIESFTQKTEEQTKEIDLLRKQLEQAHRENKEVALKVIEGAAGAAALRNIQRVTSERGVE